MNFYSAKEYIGFKQKNEYITAQMIRATGSRGFTCRHELLNVVLFNELTFPESTMPDVYQEDLDTNQAKADKLERLIAESWIIANLKISKLKRNSGYGEIIVKWGNNVRTYAHSVDLFKENKKKSAFSSAM
jgi:hypothetical protein